MLLPRKTDCKSYICPLRACAHARVCATVSLPLLARSSSLPRVPIRPSVWAPLSLYFFFLFVCVSPPAWCDGSACDFYPPNIPVNTQTKCGARRAPRARAINQAANNSRISLFLLHKTAFSATAAIHCLPRSIAPLPLSLSPRATLTPTHPILHPPSPSPHQNITARAVVWVRLTLAV